MKKPLVLALLLAAAPLAAQTLDPAEPAWQRLQAAAGDLHLELDEADPRLARIRRLGGALTSTQRRYPVQWHFAVVRSPRPDAGCTGEGAVYITSGLLDLDLDESEMAGILGHEVAHGLLRHVETNQQLESLAEDVRAQQSQVRQQVEALEKARASMDAAAYQQAREELVQRARSLKGKIDSLRTQAALARETLQNQESQADSVGLQMAARAGFPRDGLLRALRRLQAVAGLRDQLGGFRHPPLEQRIQTLEKLLQGPGTEAPGAK